MRRILIWTNSEHMDFSDLGLSRILTEVDEQGTVTRELGYDHDGNLVHRHPGKPTRSDEYGIFDLAKISPSNAADMETAEFDRLWLA